MAILDPKKLLPPRTTGSALVSQKSISTAKFIPNKSSLVKPKDITPPETEPGDLYSGAIVIQNKVLSIQKLIGNNTYFYKKIQDSKRKESEDDKFQKKEEKLEEKKLKIGPDIKLPSLPKTGFLDAIKRFLFYTFLGYAFNKFGKYIPKILELTTKLTPAISFFENFIGNVLNGVINFVDVGYDAYDKVRAITKSIGGENAEKKFDEFGKQFNTFANLAIIAGMATMGGTDFKRRGSEGGRGGSYATGYATGYAAGLASGKGIRPGAGFRDPGRYRAPGQARASGFDLEQARKAYTQARTSAPVGPRGPLDRIGRRFKGAAAQLETGTLFKRGSGIQRALYSSPGKIKGIIPKGVFGRVPIIGGLIDFIVSTVIFKEKPGRAAAKAVGSTIGAALGTFIPIPFAGTILGGILGDIVGGALYDTLTTKDSIQGRAKGGEVTRGGKKVSRPAARKIRKIKTKPPKVRPQKTIPGKDIGGKDQIQQLFPTTTDPKVRNPLGFLESTSTSLKTVPMIGGLMGASLDLAMGQKPEPSVFNKIGMGFGSLIQSAIDSETNNTLGNIQKEVVALASGGVIPRTLSSDENIGMKIGERIAKTLEAMVNVKVNQTLQALRKEFGKEGFGMEPEFGKRGPGGGQIPGDAPPEVKAMLEAISSGEGGWDSVNPGTTVSGLSNMTIADARKSAMEKGYSMKGSGAMGKWQQMPEFILERARDAGLDPNKDKFSPENQTKIARMLMSSVYPGGETQLVKDARQNPILASSKLRGTWPSLPGGSQANTTEQEFIRNYARSLQSYKSPEFGTEIGNLQLAKQLAESMGVPLYSHVRKDNPDSYHYDGRSMDFSNDSVGKGTPQQLALAKELVKRYGATAKEIFYTPLGFSIKDGKRVPPIAAADHYNHVHVAFEKGGKTPGVPTPAIVGEKGPEFVLDTDTTTALEQNFPGFLDSLNKADYKGTLQVLQNYASYHNPSGTTLMMQRVIIEKPIPMQSKGGGFVLLDNSTSSSNPTAVLYKG